MSDIARACVACDGQGTWVEPDSHARGRIVTCRECDGCGRVVPADQLEGAVDLLRESLGGPANGAPADKAWREDWSDIERKDQCERDLDSAKMYVEIAQEKPDDPRSLRYALNAIENARDQHRGAAEENARLRGVLARIAAGHAHAPKLAGEALDAGSPLAERHRQTLNEITETTEEGW